MTSGTRYLTDSSFHVQEFANGNASGNGNEVFVEVPITPFEQADSNPAMRQYGP